MHNFSAKIAPKGHADFDQSEHLMDFSVPESVSPDSTVPGISKEQLKAEVRNLDFHYGTNHVLRNIYLPLYQNRITALIGPSGCGKSTLLRCFNRMHDLYSNVHYKGEIRLLPDGRNIIDSGTSPIEMRMRIGMVFQKPNPFPKSIFENVAYGLRLRGVRGSELADAVEKALQQSALWEETKDRLKQSALELSGGQQQRLCIARALATSPEILLLDEPTSALDPVATKKIENLLQTLRSDLTMLIVTHNMQQASRVSDYTGFLYMGKLVDFDETETLFMNPTNELTESYITGRFG